MKEIESRASLQKTKWDEVIDIFNNRFFVPFEAKIENKVSSILGQSVPNIVFEFKDLNTGQTVIKQHSEVTKDEILSQGEKRAMYLLNVIFNIEAYRNSGFEVLFIIDDIADSFDYRNKYAIIQYLRDISLEPNFNQIILTHNFDFFRTVQGRILTTHKWKKSFKADKNGDLVKIQPFGNNEHRSPFDVWKKTLDQPSYLLAAIPFVRNLVEFKESSKSADFLLLTSLLHSKTDTNSITISNIKSIFEKVIDSSKLDNYQQNKVIYDLLFEEIAGILADSTDGINLDKKVILSIGIRIRAEEFIWSKITDRADITSDQTAELVERYRREFGNTSIETQKTLDKVNLITPENIHLNSFMFEPILDLSMDHLKQLFLEVTKLS